jgi:acyl-CoA thioesterase-1
MNCSKARVFLLVLAGVVLASTDFASAQIVALGHSAARGYVAENEMWSAVLESMLRARGSQVHVTNAGVNGETTAAELARVDSAVPAGTKIVILTINGYNDAHELVAGSFDAAANIAAIKGKLRARGDDGDCTADCGWLPWCDGAVSLSLDTGRRQHDFWVDRG